MRIAMVMVVCALLLPPLLARGESASPAPGSMQALTLLSVTNVSAGSANFQTNRAYAGGGESIEVRAQNVSNPGGAVLTVEDRKSVV